MISLIFKAYTLRIYLLLFILTSTLFADALVLNEAEKFWIKQHPDVTFTGDPNWLPFEAFDDKGAYIGIVSDHLKLVEHRTGLRFKPRVVKDWSESLQAAVEGEVSVISGDMADATLNKNFVPIEPYLINPIIIIMDEQQNYVEDLNTLKDKKIAIIKGYGYTADLFKHYPQMTFIEVTNIQEGLKGVASGVFDALLASDTLASYSIGKMELDNVKIVGKTTVIMEVTLFIDKNEPLLRSIVNQAIKSISGHDHEKIRNKWIHHYKHSHDNSILKWIVTILSMAIIIILFFVYREVSKNRKHLAYMKKLVSAQEVGHMGSWQWDMQSGELIWSDEVYRIFGEKPQSFPATYDRFKSYIPPEFHEGLESAIDKAMKTGEPYEYDHLIRQKDGSIRSVREAGYVRFSDKGEPVSMLGTILDINSIVQAKSALIQNKELTELLEKFDANVIASNTDLKGNITYASQAFCKISGYSYDELIGQPHNIVRHPDTPVEKPKELWNTIQAGRTWKGELKNRRKDGSAYWVESTISPIYNRADEMIGYSSIRHDITHEKKAEELHHALVKKSAELQSLNDELEERITQAVLLSKQKDHMLAQQSKLASMGEMIGNIAHQWRQPLSALSLLIQKQQILYERGLLTAEKVQESVQKGTALINKMSTTIDDFRDFFKPNKQKVDFDIKDVVEDTLNLISAALYNQSIGLVLNLREGIIIRGYKNEFSQVVLNLINNAKDVLVEKKLENAEIRIDTIVEDTTIKLQISDNGGGIPKDVIEHVFEPYFTTKEEGKGTGVGLYMSKMIIEENMQGRLDVYNSSSGAVFTISFDRIIEPPTEEKGHA